MNYTYLNSHYYIGRLSRNTSVSYIDSRISLCYIFNHTTRIGFCWFPWESGTNFYFNSAKHGIHNMIGVEELKALPYKKLHEEFLGLC